MVCTTSPASASTTTRAAASTSCWNLAAALLLEDDLLGVVTYDERLAEATRLLGFSVLAPGR